jgi:hypothetical protein
MPKFAFAMNGAFQPSRHFLALPLTLLVAFSATPVVHLQPSVTAIGAATPLTIQASDPHGSRPTELLSDVCVSLRGQLLLL